MNVKEIGVDRLLWIRDWTCGFRRRCRCNESLSTMTQHLNIKCANHMLIFFRWIMRFPTGTHRGYRFEEKLTKFHVIPAEFILPIINNF